MALIINIYMGCHWQFSPEPYREISVQVVYKYMEFTCIYIYILLLVYELDLLHIYYNGTVVPTQGK